MSLLHKPPNSKVRKEIIPYFPKLDHPNTAFSLNDLQITPGGISRSSNITCIEYRLSRARTAVTTKLLKFAGSGGASEKLTSRQTRLSEGPSITAVDPNFQDNLHFQILNSDKERKIVQIYIAISAHRTSKSSAHGADNHPKTDQVQGLSRTRQIRNCG